MMNSALLIVALALSWPAQGQDSRICYTDQALIPRTADGSIKRSTSTRAQFIRAWPCPETGEVSGHCPKWQVDHVIPLANGGCDRLENMQWLPTAIKTCRAATCKDRWERWVYAR